MLAEELIKRSEPVNAQLSSGETVETSRTTVDYSFTERLKRPERKTRERMLHDIVRRINVVLPGL